MHLITAEDAFDVLAQSSRQCKPRVVLGAGSSPLYAWWQEIVDAFASFQAFLHLDKFLQTVNNQLDKFTLGALQSGGVGDVVDVIDGSGMLASCSTLLQLQANDNGVELGVLGEFLQLNVS
jgi:hypothetical protein